MTEHELQEKPVPVPDEPQSVFARGMEFLSRALKTFFIVFAVFIFAALAWFLVFGGSFIVDSTTHNVIVLRFGKFHQTFSSGWHWFLPYPVNQIVRIPITKQEVVSAQFLPASANLLYSEESRMRTGEASESYELRPGRDGYVLLGNNSILHSEWVMTYRISDPAKYYLNIHSQMKSDEESGGLLESELVSLDAANQLLRTILNDAVIEVSAALDVNETYYDKANYEQRVRNLLVARIAEQDAGIALESLVLRLVAPPASAIDAFQQLLLAETDAERLIEQARTYQVEQETAAASEAAGIRADAESYAKRTVGEVRADVVYFEEILPKYREKPQATLTTIFASTLADAIAPVQDRFVVGPSGGAKQTLWLKLNQEPPARQTDDAGQGDKQ